MSARVPGDSKLTYISNRVNICSTPAGARLLTRRLYRPVGTGIDFKDRMVEMTFSIGSSFVR